MTIDGVKSKQASQLLESIFAKTNKVSPVVDSTMYTEDDLVDTVSAFDQVEKKLETSNVSKNQAKSTTRTYQRFSLCLEYTGILALLILCILSLLSGANPKIVATLPAASIIENWTAMFIVDIHV